MKTVYLDIAVPVPLRRSFHYLPPDGTDLTELKPGTRVQVPFGRQKLVGILLAVTDNTDITPDKIKTATRILDKSPVLDELLFSISRWAADYYQHPIGEVMHTALPVLLRQGESVASRTTYLTSVLKSLPSEEERQRYHLNRAPTQFSLLRKLIEFKLSRFDLKRLDFSSAVIKALVEKGLAEWIESEDKVTGFDRNNINKESKLKLNAEQKQAISECEKPGTHLLFGITGSGKTEIYLQAIEAVLSEGKQALVLVPEIGLTPQTIKRFQSRFHVPVAALHSGLTDRERLEVWRQARLGGAAIVIGTRSAIFTPMQSTGIIVVDEEHDSSFKQHEGFRYSARDLAVLRGQLEAIPVILGSATPSLESYNNAITGKYGLSRLLTRANQAVTASYQLIGIRQQVLDNGFSQPLIRLVGEHLAQGEQVLIFLNRRGFSPVVLCRSCGEIAGCTRCDARMTYHLSLKALICHHCGTQIPAPQNCSNCGSADLIPLGIGTQRLEQSLKGLFPDQKIIRIDRDSTRRKGAMETLTLDINQGDPAILVGTQLLAKGHHFPNVTLVAIVDIDSGFYSSDYRAVERMGQLILQVGGRAGREEKPGVVAIQTNFPDQPVLKTLIDEGYEVFSEYLLKERAKFELPPFSYQALVRAEAINTGISMQFLSDLAVNTKTHPSVLVLGPIPSNMERRAGKHRAQLLISSKDRKSLKTKLREVVSDAYGSRLANKVKWSVDVDPLDLF